MQYCLLIERNVVTVRKRITRQVYYLEAVCAVSAATYERRKDYLVVFTVCKRFVLLSTKDGEN